MTSDRIYDLSLRILMGAITFVLAGSVILLAVQWKRGAAPTTVTIPMADAQPATADRIARLDSHDDGQVLYAPGRIFRCYANGRVTFSDRPCGSGAH